MGQTRYTKLMTLPKLQKTTDPRSPKALSFGQGEPPVSCACAQQALGQRLHLCVDVEGLRLCRLRHRRLRQTDRGRAPCRFRQKAKTTGKPDWRVSASAQTGFVLDALEQALHDRRPAKGAGLIHHSDRGGQYLSIRTTERLAEAGVERSVGTVGDSYDNALAETVNGLYKAEVIHRKAPWRSLEAVEYATLEWVDGFNNRRLLLPIGDMPPAEAEAKFYEALETQPIAA